MFLFTFFACNKNDDPGNAPLSYILSSPNTDGSTSIEKSLANRRSRRNYQDKAISADQLSQILWAAYGTQVQGKRTSPSAGALYALELYVAVGNVEGIAPGVYRYISDEHNIVKIAEGDIRGDLGEGMLTKAPAILYVTSDINTAIASYGEEDIKYVYMEAGHVGQNVYLQVEALGLGTCAVSGIAGAGYIKDAFAIPANEDGIYLMPVGYYN